MSGFIHKLLPTRVIDWRFVSLVAGWVPHFPRHRDLHPVRLHRYQCVSSEEGGGHRASVEGGKGRWSGPWCVGSFGTIRPCHGHGLWVVESWRDMVNFCNQQEHDTLQSWHAQQFQKCHLWHPQTKFPQVQMVLTALLMLPVIYYLAVLLLPAEFRLEGVRLMEDGHQAKIHGTPFKAARVGSHPTTGCRWLDESHFFPRRFVTYSDFCIDVLLT